MQPSADREKGYTHIVHISDIHIRTGDKTKCRYDEYMYVFNQLAKQITTWQREGKNLIVVVTGDVFHHKSKIESAGIVLFHEFLGLIDKICDILVICGNHDYSQENIDDNAIDMIQAMMHNHSFNNVTYLQNTGTYKLRNIMFGLVAIQDVLQQGAASATIQNPVLPEFPKPPSIMSTNEIDITAALFHGTLNGCTLQNYITSPTGIPSGWFDGYDIVLLGDIHLRQTKKNWGYAGSLIQQNFGEPPFLHGGLLWDIRTKTAAPFNIRSNIGYVTVRSLEDAQSCFENQFCPPRLKVRMQVNTTAEMEEAVVALAATHNISIDVLKSCVSKPQTMANAQKNKMLDGQSEHDGIGAFDDYINNAIEPAELADNIRLWVNNPNDLCVPMYDNFPSSCLNLQQSLQQRNRKIDEQCLEYSDELTNYLKRCTSSGVQLDSMEWDWILCFKSGNRFDFNATKGNLVAINARNGQGKSSFIDIVCISLFGTCIHHLRNFASSIICMQAPIKATAKTVIRFSMARPEDERITCYEITRSFSRVANAPKRLVSKAVLKADGKLIHSGKTAVDKWVEMNVGSIESFVFSSILTQHCTESFFNMDTNQQVNMLDRCFNTNLQNKINDIFKTSILAHAYVADTLDILERNEMATKKALEEKRSLDEANIAEFEKLQENARELASLCTYQSMPPNASAVPLTHLERQLAQLLELEEQGIDFEKVRRLVERIGGNDKKDRDRYGDTQRANFLDRIANMEIELDDLEESIAELKRHPPPHVSYEPHDHEESEFEAVKIKIEEKYGCIDALEEKIASSPYAQQTDCNNTAITVSLSALNEMKKALAESMASIPKDLRHFVTSLIEPTANDITTTTHNQPDDHKIEPHNTDCWACVARRKNKNNDSHTLLSLIKHCRNTFEFIEQQESLYQYQLESQLLIKYKRAKNAAEYKRWEECMKNLETNKADLECRILHVSHLFIARQEKIRELKYWICLRKIKETEMSYRESCGNQAIFAKCNKTLQELVRVSSAVKERIKSIEQAHGAIGGYRLWLFKNRIIPKLGSQVNNLIKMVTTDDHPLQLDANVQCDGNKLTIDWFVQNGPQRPPIEKASGFQKFIASLAIRIVLTQQLGSGTRCSHLFLDEGFVACDAAHLSKVPAFLSNLLFLYDSVLVCTHLEELKDAMDMQVFIQRDAEKQLSLIDFPS
jgi:DNA repair exonuclease SbcCD ATPase subunit/DNA repair exonuclease SbcCD nuclease subunit